MFGVSFTELLLVAIVALIIVGPARLPAMLNTLGKWSTKLRRMLFDVRAQSGIDDILREEGLLGGLRELRQLRQTVRTEIATLGRAVSQGPQLGAPNSPSGASSTATSAGGAVNPGALNPGASPTTVGASTGDSGSLVRPPETAIDPYASVPYDRSREYPPEGCDAAGALPDDVWDMPRPTDVVVADAAATETAANEAATETIVGDLAKIAVVGVTLAELTDSTDADLYDAESTDTESADVESDDTESLGAESADAESVDAELLDPETRG